MKEALLFVGILVILFFIIFSLRPSKGNSGLNRAFGPVATVAVAPPIALAPLEVVTPALNSQIAYFFVSTVKVAQPPVNIHFRIRDTAGRILAEDSQKVDKNDFKITSAYGLPGAKEGFVDMSLEGDAHVITIPIVFPATPMATSIYLFTNDCSAYQPVFRLISQNGDRVRSQLDALVTGPSTIEMQKGIKTAISPSARVSGFRVANNVAAINFTKDLLVYPTGIPSSAFCPSDMLANQVKSTLIQNANVSNVTIAVDNRLPSNLQP